MTFGLISIDHGEMKETGFVSKYPIHADVINNEDEFYLFWSHAGLSYDQMSDSNIYSLRIREAAYDSEGKQNGWGEWQNFGHVLDFESNVFPNEGTPLPLAHIGFDRFDALAGWSISPDGDERIDLFQVQIFMDRYPYNAEKDSGEDYSGIHTIDLRAENFNFDIDADGAYDYFIS